MLNEEQLIKWAKNRLCVNWQVSKKYMMMYCWLIGFLRSLRNFFLPKTIKLYAQITIVLLPSPKAEWIKRVFFRIKEDFKSSISGGLDPWVLLSMDFKVSPHKENVLKIFSLIFIACLYVCGGGYHFLLFALPYSWRTVRKLKMY